ncbi:MAG: hypothetical protein Q9166_003582 [cf. Caloplaca sp. 2 TL-2023]
MSEPLSAPENTSLAVPVRLSDHVFTPQNGHASSAPKPKEITSAGDDAHSSSTRLNINGSREEHSTQNSTAQRLLQDEEVLLDSAAATPRLPPSKYGSDDLQLIPSHELETLDDSTISSGSALPHSSTSNSGHTSSSPRSPRSALVTSFSEVNLSTSGSSRRILHHGLPHEDKGNVSQHIVPAFPRGKHPSKHTFSSAQTPIRTRSQGAMTDAQELKALAAEASNQDQSNGDRERSTQQADTTGSEERRNRSSSRSGRVEKRIEATLAKAEPSTTARSRKSSHLLGLFKENTVQDPRKLPDKVSSPLIGELKGDQESSKVVPSGATTEEFLAQERGLSPAGRGLVAQPGGQQKRSESQRLASDQAKREIGKGVNSPAQHDFEGPNRPVRPNDQQENLQHHELTIPSGTKPEQRKTPIQQSLTSPKHEVLSVKDEVGISEIPELEALTEQRRPETIAEGEGEDDSDKEEISSALYYPHQAPSPDALDALDDPKVTRAASLDKLDHSDLGPPAEADFDPDYNDEAPSEEVDIALQSQNKQRYLHGDLPKAKVLQEDIAAFDSGVSSASESEYDSLDESGRSTSGDESRLLADAEMTPKASPGAYPTFLRSKPWKGRVRPPAPFGAVELKPYTHQVGGHCTVYKFSKRAVCKPLSNRENEFYEVIEAQHPELLKFLPRYIGVLNVTYRKAIKRQKVVETEKVPSKIDEENHMTGSSGEFPQAAQANTETSKMGTTENAGDKPRIVSHSQTIGPVPQVVFANNRHIIPDGLFKLPPHNYRASDSSIAERSQPESSHAQQDVHTPGNQVAGTGASQVPSTATLHHRHNPSWGSTTVNTRLAEQVLREVFSPPPIYRHHKHGRHGTTLPRVREATDPTQSVVDRPSLLPQDDSLRRQSSGAGKEPVRRNSIQGKDHHSISRTHRLNGEQMQEPNAGIGVPGLSRLSDVNGESVPIPTSRRIKRRHSGSGLRSKQNDVDSDKRSALEFYEDKGFGGEEEDALFAMDMEKNLTEHPKTAPMERLETGVASGNHTAKTRDDKENVTPTKPTSIDSQSIDTGAPVPGRGRPCNPKQAQTQPDERVQQFLLLEDLTSGMNKPCVLDLKMGTRQYGIEADEKKKSNQRRKCMVTTSQQLGVRLCGVQVWDMKKGIRIYKDKYSGRDIKAGREFQDSLKEYLYDGISNKSILHRIPDVVEKLAKLDKIIRGLPGYRFYASSLLLLYDAQPTSPADGTRAGGGNVTSAASGSESQTASRVDLKLIDFANCVTAEDEMLGGTPCPPHDPEGIDRGYLRGLRTLRMYLLRIYQDIYSEERQSNATELEDDFPKGLLEEEVPPTWNDSAFDEDLGNVSI